MKNSTGLQYHPNQEDKSGNPAFASNVKLNFSANDPRGTEQSHTTSGSTKGKDGTSIVRRKNSIK